VQPHASLPGYRTNAGLASMPGKAAPRVASFSAVMRVSCARAVRVGCLHHGLQQVPNVCTRADISPTLPAMQLTGKARPGHHQTMLRAQLYTSP